MAGKDKPTYSLPSYLTDEVEKEATENGEPKSRVVQRALEEYFSEDTGKSTHEMVSELHASLLEGDGPVSETEAKKEKNADDLGDPDDPTSDAYLQQGPLPIDNKQQKGTANRIFNHLILENEERKDITEKNIRDSIHAIGGTSEYYEETYTPLVEDRLREQGWKWVVGPYTWMQDEEIYSTILSNKWESKYLPIITGDDSLDAAGLEEREEKLEEMLDFTTTHIDDIQEMNLEGAENVEMAREKTEEMLKQVRAKREKKESRQKSRGRSY